jgi:hypothetical protein
MRLECRNLGDKERRCRGIWGRIGEMVAGSGSKGVAMVSQPLAVPEEEGDGRL